MFYSEIKSLVDSEGADVIRFVYQESNRPAVKTLLAHKYAAEILNAFFEQTSDRQEVMWMVDAIDTFLQIHNVTQDINQSAELLYNIVVNDETDASTDQYRIINDGYIDKILVEELASDSYLLGSFAAWLIADVTGWPIELIQAAQKADIYQEIGEGMTEEHIEELAKAYVQHDSYGHHFAHYDHYEHEIGTGSAGYYLFRTN